MPKRDNSEINNKERGQPKILIVEDDARLGKTLSDVLKVKGYAPIAVLTGKEGVAAVKEDDIFLALLDLKLPDISGIEVLREIKKISPRTEAIILTAFASIDTAMEAVSQGAFSYLQKPYDMERLLLDIRRALERRWARDELRTLAETYSDICDRSPIAIVNVYKNYRVDCTDRLLEWTGWSMEEMKHINLVKESRFVNVFGNEVVLPPLVSAEMMEKTEKEYIPKLIRGETLEGVYQSYNRKDGGTVPLELNSVGYFGGKEPKTENFVHTICIFSDITERKKAEETLRKSEGKYRDLGELLPEVIFETDVEGNITYANQIAFDSFCYTQSDFDKGLSALQMLIPEDRDRGKENIQRVLSGGTIGSREYTAQRKDKTTFPVIISSKPIIHENKPVGLRGVITDITERKRAEEALRESEERYRYVFESIQDVYAEVALDGTILEITPSIQSFSGYAPEEVLGRSLAEFYVYPEQRAALLGRLRLEGSVNDYEVVLRHKTGRAVMSSFTVKVVTDDSSTPVKIVGTMRDVTERKRAEEALRESEGKYRTLYDSSMDAIMTLTPEEGFLSGNPAAVEIFGCKNEKEFTSRTPHDLSPQYQPDGTLSSEKDKQMMAIAMEKGSHFFEWTHKRMDGPEFPTTVLLTRMELQGRRMLQATVRDITERKRAEEEEKKSRKFLATIIDSIPDTITIRDSQHRFVLVNQAYCNIIGVAKDEVIGKTAYWEKDKAVFQTGKGLDIPERSYTDLEGKCHYTSVKKAPLTDESGEVSHVVTISRDITEHKKADEERERLLKELETLDKMKTDFLNVAYHEMRTPLAPIVGYTSLLEQGELTDKQKNYVRIIEESASRLDVLINRLLEVTRMDAGRIELKLEPVSIPEIVTDVLERIQPQVDEKKQTSSTAVPEGIEVEGDKQKITAIFDNLISNAIKYTGEKGRIDVVVEDRKEEGDIRVCVADTGAGIPEEHLPWVFERFYMVDASLTRKEGLGLGLAIVKGYVELHGGEVWVTSEPEKGSKFWFTLPKRQR